MSRHFSVAPNEIQSALQERYNSDRVKAASAQEFFLQNFVSLSRADHFTQPDGSIVGI